MPGQVEKFLDAVGGKTRVDSSAQLAQAKAASRKYSAAEERTAKANGFQSAQAMAEFNRQKSTRRDQNTTSVRGVTVDSAKQSVSAWHPAVMLRYVLDAINGATGGQ